MGFSWVCFLSRRFIAGLSIVALGRALLLFHTYPFKQPELRDFKQITQFRTSPSPTGYRPLFYYRPDQKGTETLGPQTHPPRLANWVPPANIHQPAGAVPEARLDAFPATSVNAHEP